MIQSGSIRAFLATNFAGRLFRTLGSRPVVLSWDTQMGTISITSDDEKTEKIVSVSVEQVERGHFVNGYYLLRIAGNVYDLEIRQLNSRHAILHDVVNATLGEAAGAAQDVHNSIDQLGAFINQYKREREVTRGLVSSRNYLWLIAVAVLVLLFSGMLLYPLL